MYNIIALIGEAGSGKDRTMQEILKTNSTLHEIISYTTRPMRQGEVEGVNYFYTTPDIFEEKILDGDMLECTVFNDWYYGTSYDSLCKDKINIGVFNPSGIESLLAHSDCNIIVFWIKSSDKIRLIRQLNREINPNVREIIRRFQADYNDFDNIKFDTIQLINDTESDLKANVKKILSQSDLFFTRGQN